MCGWRLVCLSLLSTSSLCCICLPLLAFVRICVSPFFVCELISSSKARHRKCCVVARYLLQKSGFKLSIGPSSFDYWIVKKTKQRRAHFSSLLVESLVAFQPTSVILNTYFINFTSILAVHYPSPIIAFMSSVELT